MSRKNISDLQVIEAYIKAKQLNIWPYELLQHETGEPIKVCIKAMERAFDRDLIEFGVSLRSGWVTNKGLSLIESELKDGEK